MPGGAGCEGRTPAPLGGPRILKGRAQELLGEQPYPTPLSACGLSIGSRQLLAGSRPGTQTPSRQAGHPRAHPQHAAGSSCLGALPPSCPGHLPAHARCRALPASRGAPQVWAGFGSVQGSGCSERLPWAGPGRGARGRECVGSPGLPGQAPQPGWLTQHRCIVSKFRGWNSKIKAWAELAPPEAVGRRRSGPLQLPGAAGWRPWPSCLGCGSLASPSRGVPLVCVSASS